MPESTTRTLGVTATVTKLPHYLLTEHLILARRRAPCPFWTSQCLPHRKVASTAGGSHKEGPGEPMPLLRYLCLVRLTKRPGNQRMHLLSSLCSGRAGASLPCGWLSTSPRALAWGSFWSEMARQDGVVRTRSSSRAAGWRSTSRQRPPLGVSSLYLTERGT